MKPIYTDGSRCRYRKQFAGLVACAAFTACQSVPEIADAPEDYAHSYVEYLYNSDGKGNDLPITVGNFSAPARHQRTDTEDKRIQLGYVRYLPANGSNNSALVFLSDGHDESPQRRDLYAALRSRMHVIVFDRRGLGLSAPLVDCGSLDYPFTKHLQPAGLRASAREYVDRCRHQWQAAGLPEAVLADVEVAQDLYDLSRVIGIHRFYLVLERAMTGIGIEAARRYPLLIAGIVLVDPERSGSELAALYRSRLTAADPDISRQLHILNQELKGNPVVVDATTRAGTPVRVAIGDLDLAFVVSKLSGSDDGMSELSAAIKNAAVGDYTALGTLVVETRKELSSPANWILIPGVNRLYGKAIDEKDMLQFALNWPASAFPGKTAATEYRYADVDIPLLVLQSTDNQVENIRSLNATQDDARGKTVYVVNGSDRMLDEAAGVAQAIQDFIDGKSPPRQ